LSKIKPYYRKPGVAICHGDCRDILPDIQKVDLVLTDPPYGLKFMGKSWDYDIPRKDIWEKVLNVLKPGGHLFSFGGTRTYHRIVCEIEDAGFEIRDCIMWVYGSGFPKSLNIGKMVDRMQGNERGIIGSKLGLPGYSLTNAENQGNTLGWSKSKRDGKKECEITQGHSPWEGWGTALKPAYEPIVIARKPLEGTIAENVLKYGTGGLNIDACRIQINPEIDDPRLGGKGDWSSDKMAKNVYEGGYEGKRVGSSSLGRFPANLIHDGSEEVLELFPNSKSTGGWTERVANEIYGGGKGTNTGRVFKPHVDSGSAARFFYCAKASKGERNEGCEDIKAERSDYRPGDEDGKNTIRERLHNSIPKHNSHPTVKPLKLLQYLIRLGCHKDGVVLDPFMGSGSTLVAAKKLGIRAIGIETEEKYCEIARGRIGEL